MEEYSFHEGVLPIAYSTDLAVSLFNRYEHLYLQSPDGWYTFYALHDKYKCVDCLMHVHLEGIDARSPLRSPFGGIECSDDIAPVVLYAFLEFVISRIKDKGATSFTIKNAPQNYRYRRAALTETFLLNNGFQVIDAEVGTIVEVKHEFKEKADTWEKRKLRQAQEARLFFRSVSAELLDDIYLFILACRKQKGYTLSMTLADLRKTVNEFPERHHLFTIYHEGKLVAASIAIRVQDDILYNFYCDHDKEYDSYSPVVMLIDGMHRFCADESIAMLDLGTSAIEGKPNFGLLDFKLRLGGKPTPKLTFRKIW
ncbi:MAG TPA: GNAT family N-acetyltransferase [Ohtaekwangia sp.]|uniref:GNAT family N-acetyltransferase n=1 Tax=Ohtaekwangia sp. TaxID=2066019 RepID=UPI002F95E31B